MPDVELNFSRDEYATRLAKTRDAMQRAGIELLIVSDPSNMAWLTGYDGWSFYVHQCVLVPASGEPLWFGRAQDANGAKLTVYMRESQIIGYPDRYVQSTERHPMDYLAARLTDRGDARARIGVEMDNYYFSAAALRSLERHLPNARFVDATGLVNWQRAVKSPRELEYMQIAARIVEAMHARVAETIEPGLRKNALVAEILHASAMGVDGYGGDYPAIVPLLPSGRAASAPHLTWDEQPLAAGEGTFFELAGVYKRYHCPLSRSAFLGRPPQAIRDAEQAVLEGLHEGLAAAHAGNTCEAVANAFFDVLARYGIEKDNRTGYSIGLSYPPDWGERTMSLRAGDTSVLEVDMTFHFMTGLWMDEWGLEITESIVIGEREARCLANVPRALLVKD